MKEGMRYGGYFAELLIGAAVLANLVVVMSAKYFPYADVVNHIARYVLIHDFLFGGLSPDYVQVKFIPTAYIAVDMVGAALVHGFVPETVIRILAAACLIALPLGTYLFIKAIAPGQRALAVVGALLGFNWYFLYGFINYILGIALALMVMSWWWPRRAQLTAVQMALLGFASAALYLVHMAGTALVLLAVGLDYVVVGIVAVRERRANWRQIVFNVRAASLFVATLCVAGVWLLVKSATPEYDSTPSFRSVPSKLLHLATPFFSFSTPQAAIVASGYFASATMFLWAVRRSIGFNYATLLPLLLMAAYFVFPVALFGAYDVDVRFLLPAYLLVFMIPAAAACTALIRNAAYVLAIASLIHAGVTYLYVRAIDRHLEDFRQVLAQAPNGDNVLPLVADRNQYGRIDPYRHFALWRTVERRGRVPGLFSGDLSGQQLAHFVVTSHLYAPDEKWGTSDFQPLDWGRIARDYKFILQAGDDPRATAALADNTRPVYRRGQFVLYAVIS